MSRYDGCVVMDVYTNGTRLRKFGISLILTCGIFRGSNVFSIPFFSLFTWTHIYKFSSLCSGHSHPIISPFRRFFRTTRVYPSFFSHTRLDFLQGPCLYVPTLLIQFFHLVSDGVLCLCFVCVNWKIKLWLNSLCRQSLKLLIRRDSVPVPV